MLVRRSLGEGRTTDDKRQINKRRANDNLGALFNFGFAHCADEVSRLFAIRDIRFPVGDYKFHKRSGFRPLIPSYLIAICLCNKVVEFLNIPVVGHRISESTGGSPTSNAS